MLSLYNMGLFVDNLGFDIACKAWKCLPRNTKFSWHMETLPIIRSNLSLMAVVLDWFSMKVLFPVPG